MTALIHAPAAQGDLTQLLLEAPSLAREAETVLPRLITEMNNSQDQLDYLREYAPDVVAALSDLGQAGATYDADGHYERTQPIFDAFAINSANQLVQQPPQDRYNGLKVLHGRCPGGAVPATPDGSAPGAVPGCTTSSSPGSS